MQGDNVCDSVWKHLSCLQRLLQAPRTAWSRRAALCAARARRPHLRLFASKADDRVPPRVFLDKEFAAARDPEIESLMKNQQTAPRISIAEEARTLIAGGK